MSVSQSSEKLTILQPDDWHLHLRDGDLLSGVVPYTARVFRRAIVMPNLNPPITTIEAATEYRHRIYQSVPKGLDFTPLMTAYLTDNLQSEVLEYGYSENIFVAAKLYPANATTNSSMGVSDIRNIDSLLETMEKIGMPLLIHGEVVDSDIDIFDREAVFIERHLQPLLKSHPNLKVVLEHITTEQAVEFVRTSEANLAATITPHHLHINRNAMFSGGLRSDFCCLPVAKREKHRLALRRAAISGQKCFFLGTDSAPHSRESKENSCGCAGIFNAPFAMESYAEVFDQENALDRLEAFASINGANFYGFPLNTRRLTLEKRQTLVPELISYLKDKTYSEKLVPFHANEELSWSVQLD